ncbi:MAG: SMI1/KNR4 family protein [Kangiellaceae bacterium]|nr:SMI1/KNR4 family protein [Kangiellaceae bacterium]
MSHIPLLCVKRLLEEMETSAFNPPTDEEIDKAQQELGFAFPSEYITFLKSGYDLGDIPMEALEIANTPSHVNIYEAVENARKYFNLPTSLLPICEDNGDYYCLNQSGEVVFWSHNGATNEKWSGVSAWREEMLAEFNGE